MSRTKKKRRNFLVLLIIITALAVIVYCLGSYHFIRTSNQFMIIRKLHFGFRDTYVNMQKWSPLDLFYHPDLTKALIKSGYEKSLKQIQQGLPELEP